MGDRGFLPARHLLRTAVAVVGLSCAFLGPRLTPAGAGSSLASAATGTTGPACAPTISVTTGPNGPTGPIGATGASGPTGPTGPTGSTGVTGDAGSPAPGQPCWTDVNPYPFGIDGLPVDPTQPPCTPLAGSANVACYQTVTSMAFRSPNYGLAATAPTVVAATGNNPYGVWIYNGTRWFPDPTFPGSATCPGSTIVWAGKLDYWLIGPGISATINLPPGSWIRNAPSLCRYDGSNFEWEPLSIPQATIQRADTAWPLLDPKYPVDGTPLPDVTMTSASCFSWDDCWFFGTFGSVLHWDGTELTDESPPVSETPLDTAYTAAVARVDDSGNPFGVAVGTATVAGQDSSTVTTLPASADGSPAPQVYSSDGGVFGPQPTSIPTGDPYGRDLLGADFTADGQGWLAGDPVGLVLNAIGAETAGAPARPRPSSEPTPGTQEPAPLTTTTATGAPSSCPGPPAWRFAYSDANSDPSDAYLWSSLSAVPTDSDAFAGGEVFPSANDRAQPGAVAGPEQNGLNEPVIVQAQCDGTVTTTRFLDFLAQDPLHLGLHLGSVAPADRAGTVTAVAAAADNDVWAATSQGILDSIPYDAGAQYWQPPHLYQLTDAQEPDAPPGDNNESRPLDLQLDPTLTPEPPAPSVSQTIIESQTTATLSAPAAPVKGVRDGPASLYDIKSKLRGKGRYVTLYITFRLRQPATLGAEGLRRHRVVTSTPLHRFRGHTGRLVLRLDTQHYPTQIVFTNENPTVAMRNPGGRISGTVTLEATATPYHRHKVVSVSYEYSPNGDGLWYPIGTAKAAPWKVSFSTSGLTPGLYDLRAIASDSAGNSALSVLLTKRRIVAAPITSTTTTTRTSA